MYELENSVIDDVLCFILTSEASLPKDDIITTAVGFYSEDKIRRAKEVFFGICKEKNIKRKPCASHPNPSVADVEDILATHEIMIGKKFLFPRFLAEKYSSLPPASGFLPVATMLCSMREELIAVKEEIRVLRENNSRDLKTFEDVQSVKQDISDIKILLQNTSAEKVQPQLYSSVVTQNTSATERASPSSASPLEGATGNLSLASNANQSTSSISLSSQQVLIQPQPSPAGRENHLQPTGLRTGALSRAPGNNHLQAPGLRTEAPLRAPGRNQQQSIINRDRPSARVRNQSGNYQRKRNSTVYGSAPARATGFQSADRVLDVFVGGCGLESDAGQIKSHCESSGINVKNCVNLDSRSEWSKSYKISVNLPDRDKLLDPTFWPSGIFVRKFYKPRSARDNRRNPA